MTATTNLSITLIEQSQSQKEVTANKAFTSIDAIMNRGAIDKDLATPPGSPAAGDLYIIAASPTGIWAGHAAHIGYYCNSTWGFLIPNEGMCIWVNDEDRIYSWNGSSWIKGASRSLNDLTDVAITSPVTNQLLQYDGADFVNRSNIDNVAQIGVNTTSDSTNKLVVKSTAVLFDHNGSSSQIKVNKNATANTASHLFMVGNSARAEFGLVGDDDFQVKVSADGSSFNQSFVIDKNNGHISFKKDITIDGDLRAKRAIVSVSSSKTLALTDTNTFQKCTSASATVITVPADSSIAFAIGTEIEIYQEGSSAVSIAAAGGVTINSRGAFLNISARYGVATLKKTATDTWALHGDLA